MTSTAEIDIDGYPVAAIIKSDTFYDSFNDPLTAARAIVEQLPKTCRCALRRFPFAFLKSNSVDMKYTIIELETQSLAETVVVDEKASHVRVQLRSRSGTGAIPLRPRPQEWFPDRLAHVTVFVIRHAVQQPAGACLYAVFGLMPWSLFDRCHFSEDGNIVQLRSILRNNDYVGAKEKDIYESITAPVPLFDLATPPTPDDVKCTIPLPAVLSFALMWHMASIALPTDRGLLLLQRSFKYFGKASPRNSLFANKAGFLTLRHTVAQLEADKPPALFVIAQICSAFDFILQSSAEGSLARYSCYSTAFAPLANTVAEICPPGVSDELTEKLDLCIHLLFTVVASGAMSIEEARWLADTEDFEPNSVCMSYRFGGGANGTGELMLGDDLPPLGSYAVIKNGRVYVCNELVIRRCCVAFLRHFLTETAGSDYRPDSTWDARLKSAMPIQPRLYDDVRELVFDDCTKETLLHSKINKRLDVKEFETFAAKGGTKVTLPENYNAAFLYGLCKAQQKHPTAQGGPVDPDFQALALLSVAHTDECHRRHITIAYDSHDRESTGTSLHHQLFSDPSRSIDLRAALDANARALGQREGADADIATPLDDIEDIVGNLHENRALPMCAEMFVQRILQSDYLKNEDRQLYYRLLTSFQIPELDHRMVLRHMLRSTPSSKLGMQYHDVSRFERLAQASHMKAAKGKQNAVLSHSTSELSLDEAILKTTAAPSCGTMIATTRCPYAKFNRERLFGLLTGAGIDAMRAGLIADQAMLVDRDAKNMCRLHMRSILTQTIHERLPEDVDKAMNHIYHPRDFVHIMARQHLGRREAATAAIRQQASRQVETHAPDLPQQ